MEKLGLICVAIGLGLVILCYIITSIIGARNWKRLMKEQNRLLNEDEERRKNGEIVGPRSVYVRYHG
jgi:hypothetical protein